MAAHALADAQVEDRHVVDGLAVEHEDGVGELEVGDRRLRGRGGERALQRRATARRRRASRCRGESSASRMQALQEEALLVGRLAAGDRADAAAGALQRRRRPRSSARSQETGRSSPPSRIIGARDALVDVDRLVGEAALVAQPAVVDLGVVARRARAGRARRGR